MVFYLVFSLPFTLLQEVYCLGMLGGIKVNGDGTPEAMVVTPVRVVKE